MERANRIAGRDGGELEEVITRISEREQLEISRYGEIYGVDFTDKEIYDLVIDTSSISPKEVVDLILENVKV